MRGLWGNFWWRAVILWGLVLVISLVVESVFSNFVEATEILTIPFSMRAQVELAVEIWAGLLPIWILVELCIRRGRLMPSITAYGLFIFIFSVAFRYAEMTSARYFLARGYTDEPSVYVIAIAWLIGVAVAFLITFAFFRRRLLPDTPPQNYF
jgi:hypothetical protein